MISSYNDLLKKIHDVLKDEFLSISLRPYVEVHRSLIKWQPVSGVYVIKDHDDAVLYVGHSTDIRSRLRNHFGIGGDLVVERLVSEGFARFKKEEREHLCECGRKRRCGHGEIKIPEEGREEAAKRIQLSLINTCTVGYIHYSEGGPLGLRELERLAQYILVPKIGSFPHRTLGHVPIAEHVANNPIPEDIAKELNGNLILIESSRLQ